MNVAGDTIIWILAVLSLASLVSYFGRLIEFRRSRVDTADFLKGLFNVLDSGNLAEAQAICDDVNAPIGRIAATAIGHRDGGGNALREAVDSQGRAEIGRLDRRLAVLAIIAQISPLIGLLGTVVGFMRAVAAVNQGVLVSRADLMNGTVESLVAAAMGMAVAIVVSVMYGSLRVRLERIIVELEAGASQLVSYLSNSDERKEHK